MRGGYLWRSSLSGCTAHHSAPGSEKMCRGYTRQSGRRARPQFARVCLSWPIMRVGTRGYKQAVAQIMTVDCSCYYQVAVKRTCWWLFPYQTSGIVSSNGRLGGSISSSHASPSVHGRRNVPPNASGRTALDEPTPVPGRARSPAARSRASATLGSPRRG